MKEIIKGLRIILVGVTYGYGGMLLGKGCNVKGFIACIVATALIYLFTDKRIK